MVISPRSNSTATLIVFLIGVVYALGLQALMRPLTPDGLHFHRWSSEDMMQTVALKDLRQEPLRTLWFIHIQPPAFDALRAILAAPWRNLSDEAAVRIVDDSLYLVGAVLLGLLVAVTHHWLTHYHSGLALAGAVLLLLHPASIFFATFLDSTLLSSLLVLCLSYSLWRLKNGRPVATIALTLISLMLFFTRSIFQLPAILLIIISLYLLGRRARQLILFTAVTGLIAGAFVVKQFLLFGMFSTSSFTGVNLANSIGVGMGTEAYESYLTTTGAARQADPSAPAVLTDLTKPNGRTNFNHVGYLELNRALLTRYREALTSRDAADLAHSYLENSFIYFMPTSSYDRGHIIADRLPWKFVYDALFSAPVLPVLLLLALAFWARNTLRHGTLRQAVGLFLPVSFVFVVSILADKGENMRFKFWLEPTMLIFLAAQIHTVTRQARRRLTPHATSH